MEHSGGEVGENIAMGGYLGPGAGKDAVSRWYNEVGQYDYRNPGFSLQTGHFTQVVWASTTELGCAMVRRGNKEWNSSTRNGRNQVHFTEPWLLFANTPRGEILREVFPRTYALQSVDPPAGVRCN